MSTGTIALILIGIYVLYKVAKYLLSNDFADWMGKGGQ
jgi:hypothetical protein